MRPTCPNGWISVIRLASVVWKFKFPTKRLFIFDLPYCVLDVGAVRIWINETASPRTFVKRADEVGMRRMAQFAQRLSFDLTNALPRDSKRLADFFESPRIAVLKPETHA